MSNKTYTIKADSKADRTIHFIVSDESVDRDGDILVAAGCDFTNFAKNPQFLGFHNSRDFPVGIPKRWGIDTRAKNVWMDVYFPTVEELSTDPATASEKAKQVDTIYNMYRLKMLNAVSVGFKIIDAEPIPGAYGRRIKKWELAETSAVPIPSNPNALAAAKSYDGFDPETVKALEPDQPVNEIVEKASAEKSEQKEQFMDDKNAVELADQFKAQVAEQVTKGIAEAKAEMAKDREVTEKKYAELYSGISTQIESIKAAEVPDEIKLGRMVKALAFAGGNVEKAAWAMDNVYKDFPAARELKGAFTDMLNAKALNMTVPSEGGFNVPIAYSSRQIEVLYANTAVQRTPVTKLPLNNGNLTVRRMDTAANIAYFGESQKVPQTAQAFGDIQLTGKKLGAKVVLTNDLLRSNDINTDAWVIRDLQRKFALKIDSTMLYGTGTAFTPKGLNVLINQTSNVLGSTSTATTSDIPLQLVVALNSANVPEEGRAWVMHPQMWGYLANIKSTTGQFIFREEMSRGTLFGYPIYQTTQSGYTNTGTYNTSSADIWLGSWPELIWGDQMSMEIVTSKEATYFDTTANAYVSAFDRDETVVRVIGVHDFNIMHDVSFIKFTGKFAAS